MLQPITKDSAHDLPSASKEGYVLPNIQDWRNSYPSGFATPELRQAFLRFVDPLTLNFKLIINTNAQTGLFAGFDKVTKNPVSIETNPDSYPVNSALGYLLRIGDLPRFYLLANWIYKFADLVKNYDFLIQEVDGLEACVSPNPWDAFTDETVTVTFRETSDQKVESLLMLYKEIWYDNNTGSVVIPTNLNRIDVSILVYQAGYFLSDLFDPKNNTENESQLYPERFMFPTRDKLSKLDPTKSLPEGKTYPFIYHIFRFKNALINVESGSEFFSGINNNAGNSDIVNTKLKWNFWGVEYGNCFHGDWGEEPMNQIMIYLSKMNEVKELIELNDRFGYELNEDQSFFIELMKKLPSNLLGNFKDSMKSSINDLLNSAKYRLNSYTDAVLKKVNTGYNRLNNYLPNMMNNFGQGLLSKWDEFVSKPAGALMKNQMRTFDEERGLKLEEPKNEPRMIERTSANKTGSSAPNNIESMRPLYNSPEYSDPVGVNVVSKKNKSKGF